MQLDVVLRMDAAYYPLAPLAPFTSLLSAVQASRQLPVIKKPAMMGEENGRVVALAAAMAWCGFLCRSCRATRGRWRTVETLMEAL